MVQLHGPRYRTALDLWSRPRPRPGRKEALSCVVCPTENSTTSTNIEYEATTKGRRCPSGPASQGRARARAAHWHHVLLPPAGVSLKTPHESALLSPAWACGRAFRIMPCPAVRNRARRRITCRAGPGHDARTWAPTASPGRRCKLERGTRNCRLYCTRSVLSGWWPPLNCYGFMFGLILKNNQTFMTTNV